MRKDIHPEDYRLVVFKDMSNDYAFLCPSCANTSETITWEDGNEYPLFKLDISHKSHPFFSGIVTGKQIGRASCRERVCQYV